MNADRLFTLYDRVADAPNAIDRLRRFVLDLAVRGKLVEQDSADEPASELLKRIAAEKSRLVKAGKLRRRKLASRLDERPFSLPWSWNWARIRDVVSDRGQKVPDRPFTYIDVSAIDKEAGLVADPRVLDPENAPSRARKVARLGDVVYSCVRPYLLNVAIIEVDFDPRPIASTAFEVLNGHGLVLSRYTWMVLRSSFMIACVEQRQRGQAYPAINSTDFAVLPFPLPPLAEQHRIVARVDELMALCDRLEETRAAREDTRDRLTKASLTRLTAPETDAGAFRSHARFAIHALPALTARADQVKHLRQTILSLAVRGKLVAQDPTDEPASELLRRISEEKARLVKAGGIRPRRLTSRRRRKSVEFTTPRSWELTDLGSTSLKITDGAHKTPTYVACGVPFVSVKDFSSGRLDLSNTRFIPQSEHEVLYRRCDPRRGDILLARIGTLGRAVIVDTDVEFSLFVSVALIRFDRANVDPRFSQIVLNSPLAVQEFNRIKVGGATHTNKLNLGDLHTVTFPLPPLIEQQRIVAKVDELMTLCDRVEAGLASTHDTRGRLLESLLRATLKSAVCEPATVGAVS